MRRRGPSRASGPGPVRIAAVASTISVGGAARALVQVANHWASEGREVALLTLDEPEDDFYPVHPDVERLGLGGTSPSRWLGEAVVRNVSRIRALRSALKRIRPDVVLVVEDLTAVRTLLAVTGLSLPVAVWEQIDPRQVRLAPGWRLLRRLAFRRAAVLAVQVERLRPWAERFVPADRVRVVPNPAPPWDDEDGDGPPEGPEATATPIPSKRPPEGSRTVLAVGRLVPQKGFDLLLEAYAACAETRPGWRLVILGEGPERVALEKLTVGLAIDDRVELPGRVEDVAAFYRGADLFVLSSRFEGFPNVLLEAMAMGLPVVSFDCPCGPAEIVRDGRDGVLVPAEDVEGLTRAMIRLMDDPGARRRLAASAPEVRERFGVSRVAGAWERTFEELLAG